MFLHGNFSTSVAEVQKYTSTQVPSHICLHTSRDSSTEVLNIRTRYMYGNFSTSVTEVQKYTSSLSYLLPLDRSTEVLNIHTRYLHGNFSTSVAEVHKYTSFLSYLPPHPTRLIHRSTEYPYKVHVWELQYFCHRSTQVHKYTSSLSYLLSLDRSTEVLNIHTRYLHGNFSTSVTEVQKHTYNILT